jgi:hypothetical protein
VEKNFLKGKTSYKGNVELSSALDPLLQFDQKKLFHSITIIKNTNAGQLGNMVETLELFFYFGAKENLTKHKS